MTASSKLRNLQDALSGDLGYLERLEGQAHLRASLPLIADAIAAAEKEAEPLYDETFRGRLLRQALSHDEMRDLVDAIEQSQARVLSALAALDAALTQEGNADGR